MAEKVGCIRRQEQADATQGSRADYALIPLSLRNPYFALNDLLDAFRCRLRAAPEVIPLLLKQKDFREEALLRFSNISEQYRPYT